MNKDYYKILNINRGATKDEVKKSFRTLSKQHHPDKGGDENLFKQMSEAYDVLSNDNKRREYDTRGQNPFHHQGGGGSNMDDLFNQFFRNQPNQHRQQDNVGRSLNIPLSITLDDVFFGATKRLKYSRHINCLSCHGFGGTTQICPACTGRGFHERMVGNAFIRQIRKELCNTCAGAGNMITNTCNTCNGKAQNKVDAFIDFAIPTNLMPGQSFTFRNMGDESPKSQPGHLTVQVMVETHKVFKLIGKDLIYEPEINFVDVILGGKIVIPYFNTNLNIDIPPFSEVGQDFIVRGKGMPRSNEIDGNIVVQPIIKTPIKLNNRETELLNSLKEEENFKREI
tara:strand:+ start:3733 stop:4752 length:1020 start_codon:yes stop_codon:yes gene_type:complete